MGVITDMFLKVFSMGITASVVIIFILLVRGSIMRNFPKKYVYVLWLVVGVRLIFPITLPSSVSVFNLGYYVQNLPFVQGMLDDMSAEDENKSASDNNIPVTGEEKSSNEGSQAVLGEEDKLSQAGSQAVLGEEDKLSQAGSQAVFGEEDKFSQAGSQPVLGEKGRFSNAGSRDISGKEDKLSNTDSQMVNGNVGNTSNGSIDGSAGFVKQPLSDVSMDELLNMFIPDNVLNILAFIWLSGILVLSVWNLFLYIRVKQRICKAVLYHDNIFECEGICSPFVMGLIYPRIYIPFRLGEREREYILEHEKYHIYRHDYIVNFFSFLITLVYWFNPLVWVSYFCMVRDMEMSCDEHVIVSMGTDIRIDYSESLLSFAANRRQYQINLPAFGETDTRRRVKNIMKFKKKGKLISMAAVFLLLAIGVVCMTDAHAVRNDKIIKSEKGTENNKKQDIKGDNENLNSKTTINGNETIIAEKDINGWLLQLVLKKGKKKLIIEENSPKSSYTSVYEGTFYLRSCKGDKVQDKKVLTFFDGEKKLIFPENITLNLADYDGDENADDFSLGQKNASSDMEYQFYTVDEDGSIAQYSLATDRETTDGIITGNEILTDNGDINYSKKFYADSEGIVYMAKDNKTGKEHDAAVCVVRLAYLTGDAGESDENTVQKRLHKAVNATMPDDIVIEAETGVWHEQRYGRDETGYLLANSDTYKDITMRFDFIFYQDKLIRYKSKDYGFASKMEEKRIGKKQAVILVQKFAKEFIGEELESSDITNTNLPIGYNSKDYAEFSDGKGNSYIVQLNRNMVISYEMGEQSAGFVFEKQKEIDEREKAQENKINTTVMLMYFEPDSVGGVHEYFVPEGIEQEKLQKMASKLEVSYVCSEKDLKQFYREKELGYNIEYAGNVWGVYSGGYVRLLNGKDYDTDKSEKTIIHYSDLCKLSGEILKDNVDYAPINPKEIKDITSATLVYSTGELYHEAQNVTDMDKLYAIEKMLSSAKYIAGGSGCSFGEAVLTLQRSGKKEIKISLATDGCAVFRLNGVYYDYGSTKKSKRLREIFKDIEWEHLKD